MSLEEPAVEGHHDVGQPAHDGGSHSSGTVEGTTAPTSAWSVPSCWRAWLSRLQVPGEGLDPVGCSCKSAISVGEARWSGPLELPQCRTAPLHSCPVPPDSSCTLSAGASRQLRYTVSWSGMTLLLPILIAAPTFVGEWGWGVEGKQVGSTDEESQVRGCYNITFICTPTNQELEQCRLSPDENMNTGRNS